MRLGDQDRESSSVLELKIQILFDKPITYNQRKKVDGRILLNALRIFSRINIEPVEENR